MIEYYEDGLCCKPTVKITDTGSMSTYQKLCYVLDKIEEIVLFANGLQGQIDEKEDSINITKSRKLSDIGDFTGTLCNKLSACEVITQIEDNRETIYDIATKIDNKISLEYIIDGGIYPFDGIVNNEIDGGVMNV